MKKFILFAFLAVIFSSCIIITDNYYKYLLPQQQAKIKHLSLFEEAEPGYVYKITGTQLMAELKNNEKSMVYIFANSCSSHSENHLLEEKKYAIENGLKLFLIMSNYNNMTKTLNKNLGLPVYSINNEAYDEAKSRKYGKTFREEIGYNAYKETLDGEWPGRYLIYEKDQIVDSKRELGEEL